MATNVDTLASALSPILGDLGVSLYDLELGKGVVKVTITKTGGITLDELTAVNRAVSTYLDDHEPFERRYTLEVSSPGVERPLRTPAHFVAAVGEGVKIKAAEEVVAARRVDGTIAAATVEGISVTTADGSTLVLRYDQIERARTVYAWGADAKPSPSRGGGPRGQRRAPKSTPERITTP